jgi:hypothetical protein
MQTGHENIEQLKSATNCGQIDDDSRLPANLRRQPIWHYNLLILIN